MPRLRTLFLLSTCLLAAFSSTSEGRRFRYDRFKVYEYTPRSVSHVQIMKQIERTFDTDVVFWRKAGRPNMKGSFMVSPTTRGRLLQYLRTKRIPVVRTISNVQRLVDRQVRQNRHMRMRSLFRTSAAREPHTYYMRFSEMVNWMKSTAQNCPHQLTCSVSSIGRSHQLRKIYIMKISNGRGRKKFWIDAGIHPREWIAPSTALYLIKKLTDYGDEAKALLNKYEFHILPLMNPDGYEYTHTHSRFWRKNLVPSNFYCIGVDLNRNFGYHWGGSGSSDNPCADNYRGRGPFSEPETRAVRSYLQRHNSSIVAYFTLHAYGQFILIPFGHRREAYPQNKTQLMEVGNAMAARIERFSGRFYDVGSAADLLYEASGGSTDYVSAELNIPYTYTFELPDTGRYAFFLPSQYIIHVGKEMWVTLREFASHV